MRWSASITIDISTLSLEDIQKNPERYKEYFNDLNNPTDDEIEDYFEEQKQYLAGSNSGSEEIANAFVDWQCHPEK